LSILAMFSKLCITKRASRFLARTTILLLATPLALIATSRAQDVESALSLWLTRAQTKCIPDPPESSIKQTPANCLPGQISPLDVAQLHKLVNAATKRSTEDYFASKEPQFFDDFSHDQIKESHCELNLLDALDQIPSVPDAPLNSSWGSQSSIARALTLATDDNSAIKTSSVGAKNQQVIIKNILKMLPRIEALQDALNATEKQLPAGALEGLTILSPASVGEDAHLYRDARAKLQAFLAAEAAYHGAIDQLMDHSGSDDSIQDYVENLIRAKRSGLSDATIMNYAMQAVDPARPELSFQQKVVEPLHRSTIQRICNYETFNQNSYERSMWNDGKATGICGNYSYTSWSQNPDEQTNGERNRKRVLMETDTALDFMQKSPQYEQDYSEFSCMLLDKYRKGPRVIHTGENVAFMAATFGMGLWLNSMRAAYAAGTLSSTADELIAASARAQSLLYNSSKVMTIIGKATFLPRLMRNECASDGGSLPQSILAKPVCGRIKPGDPQGTQMLEKSVQEKDCLTTAFLTAIDAKLVLSLLSASDDQGETSKSSK
jgi:hypothetical protein